MKTRIKSIQINALRGIPHLELDLGKNTIIKGDNGTGKSSIVQAFEYLFTGSVSSLEGTQGISVKRNLNHIDHELTDIYVTAQFSSGNIEISRRHNVEPKIPAKFNRYYEGARNGKFILTRADMLKFVLAKPADRFKAISSVIGTEKIDDIEVDFKRFYDKLLSDYNSQNRNIERLFSEVTKSLGTKIRTKDEILQKLNAKRSKASLSNFNSLDQLSLPVEEQVPIIDINNINEYAKISNIKNRIQIKNNRLCEIDIEYINTQLDKINMEEIKRVNKNNERLINIGIVVLSESNEDICPLCERGINRNQLLKDIRHRMRILNQMTSEWKKIEDKLHRYSFIRMEVSDNYDFITNEIENLDFIPNIIPRIREEIIKIDELNQSIKSAISELSKIPLINIRALSENYNTIQKEIIRTLDTRMSQIIDPKISKNILELVDTTGKIKIYIEEIDNSTNIKNKLRKKLNIMKIMYETFSKIKETEIKKIYENIKKEINEYHQILHENDPHYNIDIGLSRSRSTNLTVTFSDKEDVHPKAYLSEGHQDSLGLCIFLAFAKKFNQDCNLLILDDVVSTIDSSHREFIGKLLKTKFSDFQHIITTHDEIWVQEITKSLALKRYTIAKWTVQEGPIIVDHIPEWSKIKKKIEGGDKSAGGDSRTYLEWVLKNAAANTRTKLVYKPYSDYTIGNMFGDVKNRYKTILKNKEKGVELSEIFSEIESRTFMANILMHDNPLMENLSITEISRFCHSVHNLHTALCCSGCGSFLIYPESIKRLQCQNEKCVKPTIIID